MGVEAPSTLAGSRSGNLAAVGTSCGAVLLWNVHAGTCVESPEDLRGSAVAAMAMAPLPGTASSSSSSLLVTGAADGRVAFYRVAI